MRKTIQKDLLKLNLLFIFIGLMTVITFSQNQELDSIRWIKVEKTNFNSTLFLIDSTNLNESLILTVKNFGINGANIFYEEFLDIDSKETRYPSICKNAVKDNLIIDSSMIFDAYDEFNICSNSILIAIDHKKPYTDKYDNQIILKFKHEDGTNWETEFYGAKGYYEICINYISQIRIKEELVWDNNDKVYKFTPTGILFLPQSGMNGETDCWIDLDKMCLKNPQLKNSKWYKMITERTYDGSQFMQIKVKKKKPN